ncbi:MAG: VCBS repeat-containing protein [Cytophagales bacterium]|nr:VCBS repeat-containing protein [Cytophagales bacterium]
MKRIISMKFDFQIFYTSVAILVLGCSAPPENEFTIIDPIAAGITFKNDITETHHNNILRNEYTYNGGGVAVGDINNDGYADIYFSGNSVSNKLYLNLGDWEFKDITRQSATAGRNDWATGVTIVDINGDNWLDIYVCYSGNSQKEGYNLPVIKNLPNRANQLFINNGCKPGGIPTFEDKAREYGLDAMGTFSNQAYFFDYDLDGDLDMLLLNHANSFYAPFINTKKLRNLRHPYFGNKLFRNDNLSYVEVSTDAGIHGGGLNFGLSASITDMNQDSWPDILVTNDYDEQDYCYINNQDGSFREVSKQVFAIMPKSSMGSDIADINNDGYTDILVLDMLPEENYRQKLLRGQDRYERYQLAVDSGFHHQILRNMLQLNRGLAPDGLPRFSEIGQLAGISNTDWSWSPLIVDLDNDGLRDIFITNGYLRDITNMDYMRHTSDVYKMAAERGQEVNYLRLIEELPTTKLENYIYKNEDGLNFSDMTGDWGLDQKNISNGAAYADFDNDGDYDLITNNLNQTVTLIRNDHEFFSEHNYIKIRLVGSKLNAQGIGAKIWIETEDRTIFQEVYNTRGYLSSSDFISTIGLGSAEQITTLRVVWPEGRESLLSNIAANQLIEVSFDQAEPAEGQIKTKPNKTFATDVTSGSGIDFEHVENEYDDFGKEKLLHYKLSRLGGEMATADVNGDGNDDLFFGAATGQSSVLYLGTDNATFVKSKTQPWSKDSCMEDMKPFFFDADSDGDPDLYIVSGGIEFEAGSGQYQDRLYLNDGKGRFRDSTKSLPRESTSGSCVTSGDFDKDGDLDLFVGGRHLGLKYPFSPESFVLRNDSKSGKVLFTKAIAEVSASLSKIGMVTDALWTDYDGDSWLDLIIVGEWMRVEIFKNENGKLVRREEKSLDKSNGWWTSIEQIDLDEDGDMDYLLGNAGTNFQLKATAHEPIELFAEDFDNNGMNDPIMCYYIQGRSYPFHSRDELLSQLKPLEKRFPNYVSYAGATIYDILGPELLEKTYRTQAYLLESCWLENNNGSFLLRKLPELVQFSQVNSFVKSDIDGDGNVEIIAGGNFHDFKPQIGMLDASKGVVLRYYEREMKVAHDVLTPIWIDGNVRDMKILSFNSGQRILAVSRNNDSASIFLLD